MFIRFQCSFFPLILREKKQTIRLHRYWILHMDIEPKITYHGVKELIYITAFFNVTLSCVLNSWGIIDPSWRRKWQPTPVVLPGESHGQSLLFSSVQFSLSVTQSCLTLCDPMNRSTPGLPVYHQLPEFTQTCVHRVRDAIQPSHPRSSTSPPAPNPSQHQSLFQWVNSLHEVAKVLELQL